MKKNGTCPKCNSTAIIPRARVRAADGQCGRNDVQVAVDADPDALLFKGTKYSDLQAYVCENCGFVEFYADDVGSLLGAYGRGNARG